MAFNGELNHFSGPLEELIILPNAKKRPFSSPKTYADVLLAPLGLITHRLGEEHTLLRPQLKLSGSVLLVAIVKMNGQTLRSREQVDVLGN